MKAKLTSLFFVALLFLFLFFLLSPRSEKVEYKQSDSYTYALYTDADIKKAPRISEHYSFSYIPPDGGQREMSTVTFTGGSPVILREYLTRLGFILSRVQDNGREEIWLAIGKRREVFSLWHNENTHITSLTKTVM